MRMEASRTGRTHGTLLTAHSGCDGTPDNSLPFLAYALTLAVDCLEVDIRRNTAGELVLAHDETEPDAPSLADAFSLLARAPGMRINCDLKTRGLERPVWTLALAHGVGDRLIYSGEVSATAMAADPAMRAAVSWFYNLELRHPRIEDTLRAQAHVSGKTTELAEALAHTLHEVGADCLNLNWRLRETPLWQALLDAGIPLSVWTPDDPEVIRTLLTEGVRNITTRNARAAAEIRRDRLNPTPAAPPPAD